MEKQVNQHKSYKRGRKLVRANAYVEALSSSERFLLSSARAFAAFRVRDIKRVTGWNARKAYNTLQSLKKKELVVNPKRNRYALKSFAEKNAFQVATSIVVPSYASFWSALSFYGFTEQQVSAVQLVSVRQEKGFALNGHFVETTTFCAKRFFGYERQNGFSIATREKALIDSLYMPEKSGGFTEVVKCLQNAWSELNKERLAEYLVKFGNKSLCARAGYLIEKLGFNAPKELLKSKPKGFVKLNPSQPKARSYNKKWKIMENWEAREE